MSPKKTRKGSEARERRNTEMADLFKSGRTLTEIGELYSVSRERVRQVLKGMGIVRKDGGQYIRSVLRGNKREKASDELKQTRVGCTNEQWDYYRSMNEDYKKIPLFFYFVQKSNAKSRGICWDLTINEWWYTWNESGKWKERGQGKYVMARHGDDGGYTMGNVYITTSSENAAEYYMLHMDDYVDSLIKGRDKK